MQPRFPPQGTPAWYAMFEQQLLVERVDNERQWRLLRQIVGLTTGLDPIVSIVNPVVPLGTTTTSTTTAAPTTTTSTTTAPCGEYCYDVTISGITGTNVNTLNGTYTLTPEAGYVPPSCTISTREVHGTVTQGSMNCSGFGAGLSPKWFAKNSQFYCPTLEFIFTNVSGQLGDSTIVYNLSSSPGCASGTPSSVTLNLVTCP